MTTIINNIEIFMKNAYKCPIILIKLMQLVNPFNSYLYRARLIQSTSHIISQRAIVLLHSH